MKKITLLVAGLLFAGSLASATETKVVTVAAYHTPVDYRNAEPVIFMERGIEFMVFPDGQMDFNTQPATTGTNYYRTGSRANNTYGAPGYNNAPQGVVVEHDYNGRVRRVGNVYINYDNVGRVKRIGSVYMTYNRFALSQIGLLTLYYDRNGRIVDASGYVNSNSRSYTYDPCQNTSGSYNGGGQGNSYNSGSNGGGYSDNYYYRQGEDKDKKAEATEGRRNNK